MIIAAVALFVSAQATAESGNWVSSRTGEAVAAYRECVFDAALSFVPSGEAADAIVDAALTSCKRRKDDVILGLAFDAAVAKRDEINRRILEGLDQKLLEETRKEAILRVIKAKSK